MVRRKGGGAGGFECGYCYPGRRQKGLQKKPSVKSGRTQGLTLVTIFPHKKAGVGGNGELGGEGRAHESGRLHV